jgi:two-component system, OmpR family, sensor histidine kinase BaeS
VTAEPRRALGPLGRRLLAAFVLVALSSVVVLTGAALIGTSRGLTAGEGTQRAAAGARAAAAAGDAYRAAGGWAGADLRSVDGIAAQAGARLLVLDSDGSVLRAPGGEIRVPGSAGAGAGAGRGAVVTSVVVDKVAVGSVRLAFGSPATATAKQIAWTWISVAAVAALLVAFVVSWFVTRRIARPLVRLSDAARAFASGDRSARATPADLAGPGELGALARAFDTTADDVFRSETARRRMAADVAHELRTPLAALQAGLEELCDGLVEPDVERLGALHDQSVRLARVVGDLAELSAAETAVLSLRRTRLDLGGLVSDAVAAARPTLDAAGLVVRTELAPRVVVDGDVDRLHQAVGNLLTNVARYCRHGDTATVSVSAHEVDALVVVADSGPGIPPEELPHVFDRLWRGRTNVEVAGSGIGLAVVRELVTAHGGTVAVTSDADTGSTFTLCLPLAPSGRSPLR